MKRIMLIAVIGLAVTAGAVFANGTQERGVPAQGAFTGEIVSLQGTLELKAGERPVLKTSDGEYELMYPYYLADEVNVKDGDRISVEGFLVPGPRWEKDGDTEQHLRVTQATISGKTYVLPEPRGRMAFGGRRSGGYGCSAWDDDDSGYGSGYGRHGGRGSRGMMGW